ncbi:unnamed protein product [Dibothriocephalus latus]|uniref:Uncharacterized protein n=1 Tax=Dibothriocephalus latus TaxID=60516 RepID=A0A3P7LAZ9_DIBLA|nr:unnamed protein product [Dibothriocephalus latus]
MSLLMIRVTSSRDCRAHIQNGFWFFKIAIIIGIMIGAFFITDPAFITTWMFFGIVLGFLYILVQLVLLVDFAHSWNEMWVNAYEETESRIYACALLFTTFFFYGLSIAAVVLFYIYFGNASICVLGKTLTSFNLILCVIATIVSILPAIQEKTPRSGLLQVGRICFSTHTKVLVVGIFFMHFLKKYGVLISLITFLVHQSRRAVFCWTVRNVRLVMSVARGGR